jgi:hypothetical protein
LGGTENTTADADDDAAATTTSTFAANASPSSTKGTFTVRKNCLLNLLYLLSSLLSSLGAVMMMMTGTPSLGVVTAPTVAPSEWGSWILSHNSNNNITLSSLRAVTMMMGMPLLGIVTAPTMAPSELSRTKHLALDEEIEMLRDLATRKLLRKLARSVFDYLDSHPLQTQAKIAIPSSSELLSSPQLPNIKLLYNTSNAESNAWSRNRGTYYYSESRVESAQGSRHGRNQANQSKHRTKFLIESMCTKHLALREENETLRDLVASDLLRRTSRSISKQAAIDHPSLTKVLSLARSINLLWIWMVWRATFWLKVPARLTPQGARSDQHKRSLVRSAAIVADSEYIHVIHIFVDYTCCCVFEFCVLFE